MNEVGFPVTLTPEAIAQAHRLLARAGNPDAFLRVGVKGGGCSGLEYVIFPDDRRRADDLVQKEGDLEIVCDPRSAKVLQGSVLRFSGNLIGNGFVFDNPNAERSCGCGTSFSLKQPLSE
ncbi:MAG: iron-sulfur cluster assembly accessory protein [Fimbriimonadaceae bacterium]|uniref:Iron-sulfur cluster assembly accessory protein n=1 Tax=Candidatus Nitrosymbiomonas proteolyticus TaxID=2608984 RepID=A0A809R7T6_9BACT|nr:MAG: Iron-sulfur cluster assembly accessory protein [Armatimonadetes bacterium OLB18]MBV6491240.1 Iron-sulfur cluster insertion protein ErpA [Fimbriimonadaceae bacterium]NUM38718.1 iron-sulfur cluster assembly accessory protein [Armatimonadota bacterium]QOJ11734.1 MAG: iron-sulfur cluster assembly accessory protein [Chthonomonadaceae bacterium]BBO23590.1 iron-sulfur cluster assembly accessory protein [Candidatus Nitrosymbiomonas proteolyticus]